MGQRGFGGSNKIIDKIHKNKIVIQGRPFQDNLCKFSETCICPILVTMLMNSEITRILYSHSLVITYIFSLNVMEICNVNIFRTGFVPG